MKGLPFDLCGGRDYRNLLNKLSQIHVMKKPGERPYLMHNEDILKNHLGGFTITFTQAS